MSFVARAVVVGFVNALAILIFMAQLPELVSVTWHVYALTIIGLEYLSIPLCSKNWEIITFSFVTIVLLTIFVYFVGWDVRNVGDMGELPDIFYQYFCCLMFL